MRTLLVLSSLLVPTPGAAQLAPAPRPSVLFAVGLETSALDPDTTRQDTGITAATGGLIGAGLGGLAGYATVELIGSFRQMGACPDLFATCKAERPSTGMFILGSAVGTLVGYLVGSALARD
jgi:hypothetical protein